MKQVGITSEGKKVVSGVFKLCDTVGLPLDIVVQELADNDLVPAWDVFAKDAQKAGWTLQTLKRKMAEVDIAINESSQDDRK